VDCWRRSWRCKRWRFDSINNKRNRQRLSRHLGTEIDFAPSSTDLELEYHGGAVAEFLAVIAPETFLLDAKGFGDHGLGRALGGHLLDVMPGQVVRGLSLIAHVRIAPIMKAIAIAA
jgi:hypothetical protein